MGLGATFQSPFSHRVAQRTRFKLKSSVISFPLPFSSHSALESFSTGRLARHLVAKTLPVCRRGATENAGAMRYGQNSKGGKYRSKLYGTPTRDYIEKTSSYFVTPTPGTRPVSSVVLGTNGRPVDRLLIKNVENFLFSV